LSLGELLGGGADGIPEGLLLVPRGDLLVWLNAGRWVIRFLVDRFSYVLPAPLFMKQVVRGSINGKKNQKYLSREMHLVLIYKQR